MLTERLFTKMGMETNDRISSGLVDVCEWRDQRTQNTREHGKVPTRQKTSRKTIQCQCQISMLERQSRNRDIHGREVNQSNYIEVVCGPIEQK